MLFKVFAGVPLIRVVCICERTIEFDNFCRKVVWKRFSKKRSFQYVCSTDIFFAGNFLWNFFFKHLQQCPWSCLYAISLCTVDFNKFFVEISLYRFLKMSMSHQFCSTGIFLAGNFFIKYVWKHLQECPWSICERTIYFNMFFYALTFNYINKTLLLMSSILSWYWSTVWGRAMNEYGYIFSHTHTRVLWFDQLKEQSNHYPWLSHKIQFVRYSSSILVAHHCQPYACL